MAEEGVVLISAWTSPFGARVKIALHEKGVEYDYVEEDLLSENKSPLLLKTNPVHRKIPVLIHGGRPVCESSIIVQYIDETWSGDGSKLQLLPCDSHDRARARFWVNYIDQKIYSTGRLVWGVAPSAEAKETAKKELLLCFKELEKELGTKEYFGGKSFGFVDVCLIPFYSRFYALEKGGGLIVSEECPGLEAWANRCLQRQSVSESLPDQRKVYNFILEANKKLQANAQAR
ncbi:hypothetical protein MLD38_008138 [Melastoma candidum]|uniref:Uncharacterized protein n=1 Tax=Melastoma candidum TaxID=119954 RepID=A0ACB9RTB1_9MYRT|nr:hypothetical protein MLD38_008138 [Melastoma candidum]